MTPGRTCREIQRKGMTPKLVIRNNVKGGKVKGFCDPINRRLEWRVLKKHLFIKEEKVLIT